MFKFFGRHNHQKCDSCINDTYVLENSNCLKECSNQYYKIGNKCEKCQTDNNCNLFVTNTCTCKKCNNHYYLKNEICQKCDDSCNECDIISTNCTNCPDNNYLYENKCYNCQREHCDIFRSDNCACNVCKEHYYNKNDECLSCIKNCKKYSNYTQIFLIHVF